MSEHDWVRELPAAVLVCDAEAAIVEMNDRAARTYAAEGGRALLGRNLLDCHPEPARTKLATLMAERRSNAYTIEKKGVRKLIYQAPWFRDGAYAGFVEVSFEIPAVLPHFVRS